MMQKLGWIAFAVTLLSIVFFMNTDEKVDEGARYTRAKIEEATQGFAGFGEDTGGLPPLAGEVEATIAPSQQAPVAQAAAPRAVEPAPERTGEQVVADEFKRFREKKQRMTDVMDFVDAEIDRIRQ